MTTTPPLLITNAAASQGGEGTLDGSPVIEQVEKLERQNDRDIEQLFVRIGEKWADDDTSVGYAPGEPAAQIAARLKPRWRRTDRAQASGYALVLFEPR